MADEKAAAAAGAPASDPKKPAAEPAPAPAVAKAVEDDGLVERTVARGRSLIIGGGLVGEKPHQRQVKPQHARAGDIVRLHPDEAAELVAHGFLLRPDGVQIAPAGGPPYLREA